MIDSTEFSMAAEQHKAPISCSVSGPIGDTTDLTTTQHWSSGIRIVKERTCRLPDYADRPDPTLQHPSESQPTHAESSLYK